MVQVFRDSPVEAGWRTSRGRGYQPMVFPTGLHGDRQYPVPNEPDYSTAREAVNVAVAHLIRERRGRPPAAFWRLLSAMGLRRVAIFFGHYVPPGKPS